MLQNMGGKDTVEATRAEREAIAVHGEDGVEAIGLPSGLREVDGNCLIAKARKRLGLPPVPCAHIEDSTAIRQELLSELKFMRAQLQPGAVHEDRVALGVSPSTGGSSADAGWPSALNFRYIRAQLPDLRMRAL